jgi:serine/threonine protein kinase
MLCASCAEQPNPNSFVVPLSNTPVPPSPIIEENLWQGFPITFKGLKQVFFDKNRYLVSNKKIKKHFVLNKKIAGKSDSYVYFVTPRNYPDVKRIFKVLPLLSTSNILDDIAYKEIYFSARLSNLEENKYLPPDKKSSVFFPKYYGMGFVENADPFREDNGSHYFPFYIIEEINGLTLMDFVMKPNNAKKLLGYDYNNASPNIIFSILLQLGIALYNANMNFGFIHNDLHPGNIILSSVPLDMDFKITTNYLKPIGPLIRIIDFDQGEDPMHQAVLERSFKTWGRQVLGIIGPSEEFYKKINPNKSWRKLVFNCYFKSPNMDMFMLNLLLHTFETKLAARGLSIKDKYFDNLKSYIEYLGSNASKF